MEINIKESIEGQWHSNPSEKTHILCAEVIYPGEDHEDIIVSLQEGGDVSEFLDKLDFKIEDYNLHGTIWWKNGGWSSYEATYDYCYYDWNYYRCPSIPLTCKS